MRHRMISLCAIALSACASQATAPEALAPETPVAPAVPAPPEAGVATEATRDANAALAARLPLDEQSDVEDAARGRIAYIDTPAILAEDGHVVWAIPQFDFLKGDAPDTVNPSLWRQSRLAAEHGLFEVGDGIWQVRGYDLSVMSVIEGKTGWIIVDPLTSTETASAALKLVNDTLGERPVTGLLYTHSHADHFGGARGVLTEEDAKARKVPILAPVGFLEHAVSENLIAGNQMSRRSTFMFGNTIPRSPTAHVGSGLGPGLPQGTISLIAPTEEISGRGTQRVIDGVTFEFIDAAGTEAPAEFMFYLPEKRALCTAEVVTATFHNLLTPRGAKVRDALGWSRAIDYVLETYGDKADVVFASHHWPTWGEENVDTLGAKAFEAGDYRWAAEVFNHAVFAAPESETARNWLAATYEQLGFQAESGAWRSYFLVGASELRNGIPDVGNPQLGNPEFLRAVKSIELMDSLAARFNPAKMTAEPFAVNLVFPDRDEALTLHLGKSVLVPREGRVDDAAVTLTLDRAVFDLVLLGKTTLPEQLQSGAATVSGNPAMLQAFFGTLDRPDFWFPVVTP